MSDFTNLDFVTPHSFHSLIGWRWHEISEFFSFAILLLTVTVIKLIYLKNRKSLSNIPESCALILLGIVLGLVIVSNQDSHLRLPEFTPSLFNFILLPPIVLDSSYELHHQIFFGNIGTIIMFAVVGTLMNVILVTYLIYFSQAVSLFGKLTLPTVEIFMFAVIVSAVDPVAVLSVFQEVNVNRALYFLVFGESLLNDAVVITLYDNVRQFSDSEYIKAEDVIFGLLSFVSSTLGGLLVGIFWGIVTCLITQLTSDRKLKVIEPIIVITLAYLAYITGYLLNFSAILSIMSCGLFQEQYATPNISKRSESIIKYMTKISSSLTETIIFLFLGFVLVQTQYHWNTSFVIFSTFYCIVARFLTTFFLTYIVNVYFQRIRIVSPVEQILMAYGGLRGAIAFSLSDNLDHPSPDSNEIAIVNHRLITTTTLFIILFTVFVLGSTTKPLVKMLRVQIHTKRGCKHFTEFNNSVARLVMQGIEVIAGQQSSLYWMKKIVTINEKYLKKYLLRQFTGDNTVIPAKQGSTSLALMSASLVQRFDTQKLETPEKDLYPDLNKRLTKYEAFNSQGTLLFPRLDLTLIKYEPDEKFITINEIKRLFIIPKECCSLINSWYKDPSSNAKSKGTTTTLKSLSTSAVAPSSATRAVPKKTKQVMGKTLATKNTQKPPKTGPKVNPSVATSKTLNPRKVSPKTVTPKKK